MLCIVAKIIVLLASMLSILGSSIVLAGGPPQVKCTPDWDHVTWEIRYDQAQLARLRLRSESLVPGQLAVATQQEVAFTPSKGQEVSLPGGWMNGGYVFDEWDELLKLLENSVGGISIKQPAFTQNANRQIFALTPDQQKALHSQKGILDLKVSFLMYKLILRAKFSLDAPAPVENGGITYQVVPAGTLPAYKNSNGMVTYLNGKPVSDAEAVKTLSGNNPTIDVSRKGTLDPADKLAGRALVYLLVNPDDHTAMILQPVAPNGFFDPRRDPSRLDVVDHLGIVPDKTPLKRKILYIFDPKAGETTVVKLNNPEFIMQWPQNSGAQP